MMRLSAMMLASVAAASACSEHTVEQHSAPSRSATPRSDAASCPAGALCWVYPLPSGVPLHDVWIAGDGTGFAVGRNGTVLRIRGSRIERLDAPRGHDLRAVAGRSARDVCVAGAGGYAARFDGARWTPIEGLPELDLRDVAVDAQGRAWLVALDGVYRASSTRAELVRLDPAVHATGVVANGAQVWIGTDRGVVSVRADGRLDSIAIADGVSALCAGPQGVMVASGRRVLRVDAAGALHEVHRDGTLRVTALACPDAANTFVLSAPESEDPVRNSSLELIRAPGARTVWFSSRGTSSEAEAREPGSEGGSAPFPPLMTAIAMRDGEQGLVVGSAGRVHRITAAQLETIGGSTLYDFTSITSAGEGVFLATTRGGEIVELRDHRLTVLDVLPRLGLERIARSSDGTIYLAGFHYLHGSAGLLARKRGDRWQIEQITDRPYGLFYDGHSMWIVGERGIVHEWAPSMSPRREPFPSDAHLHALHGANGRLYAGGEGVLYERRDGAWRSLVADPGSVNDLHAIGDMLWVASDRGLARWRRGALERIDACGAREVTRLYALGTDEVYAATALGVCHVHRGRREILGTAGADVSRALIAGDGSRVVIASADGPGGLLELRSGASPAPLTLHAPPWTPAPARAPASSPLAEARRLARAGDWSGAADAFDDVDRADTFPLNVDCEQGWVEFQSGDPGSAQLTLEDVIRELDTVLDAIPADTQAACRYNYGRLLDAQGRLTEAEAQYRASLALRPSREVSQRLAALPPHSTPRPLLQTRSFPNADALAAAIEEQYCVPAYDEDGTAQPAEPEYEDEDEGCGTEVEEAGAHGSVVALRIEVTNGSNRTLYLGVRDAGGIRVGPALGTERSYDTLSLSEGLVVEEPRWFERDGVPWLAVETQWSFSLTDANEDDTMRIDIAGYTACVPGDRSPLRCTRALVTRRYTRELSRAEARARRARRFRESGFESLAVLGDDGWLTVSNVRGSTSLRAGRIDLFARLR